MGDSPSLPTTCTSVTVSSVWNLQSHKLQRDRIVWFRPRRPSADLTLVAPTGYQADVFEDHVGGTGVIIHGDPREHENRYCWIVYK